MGHGPWLCLGTAVPCKTAAIGTPGPDPRVLPPPLLLLPLLLSPPPPMVTDCGRPPAAAAVDVPPQWSQAVANHLPEAFSSLVRQAAAHPQKDMVPAPNLDRYRADGCLALHLPRHLARCVLEGRVMP